jgi:hypothetical protein
MAFSSDDKTVKTELLSFFFQVKYKQEAIDEPSELRSGRGKAEG